MIKHPSSLSSSQRALLRAAAVPEGPEPHAEPDGAAPVRRRQDRECVRRWAHGRQGHAAVRAEGAEETLARRHRYVFRVDWAE